MGKLQTILLVLLGSWNAFAGPSQIGRQAAARYLTAVPVDDQEDSGAPSVHPTKHSSRDDDDLRRVLMLGIGTYVGSQSYQWKGSGKRESVGRANYGVTYLIDKWKAFDMNLRVDYFEYKIDDDHPTKLSFLPLLTFPSADKNFPLYFGLGAGVGIFFQQIPEQSNISIDYELVAGARFQDLFQNFGFFFELAMKNHLLLLSSGQLNGTTLNVGGVFTF